ncbi:MAG: OmpP1/FadL family transporter [Acidobacteriota bacterium]
MGQYEDEAPFRTWNTFGLLTGASLSTGGAHYAYAFDLSAALTNPSQLSQLPRFTAVINGSLNKASFFKYAFINTGPAYTDENSSLILYSLDFGGISWNLNGWGFSLSTSILENYDRPSALFQYKERGSTAYEFEFGQTGLLRNVNLSLSKNLGNQISVGLGLNYVKGNLKKEMKEEYYSGDIIMTDNKSYEWQNFYLNGGITIHLNQKTQAAVVFRTPYQRKSTSESLLRYQAVPSGTDIKIESQENSTFSQPLILGAGINYWFSDQWRAAADVTFFNWGNYKAKLFGEERPRDFKNIVNFGAGIEYQSRIQLFGLKFNIPLWLGFHYDPQPMKNPQSSYSYVTFGTGLTLDHFFLNAGAALGYERGSGDKLMGQKVILTLGYKL